MFRSKLINRWWWAAMLAALSTLAWASTISEVRKQAESSRLIMGTVDIDAAGHVVDHRFDDVEELAPSIRQWLDARIATWEFDPVERDGKPSAEQLDMILRIVRENDDGQVRLSIRSASFTPQRPSAALRARSLKPPTYPDIAARLDVGATVYVVVRFGPDGKVTDAMAEQVNLRALALERHMETLRKIFSDAALRAARKWEFERPNEESAKEFHSVRIPVDFVTHGKRLRKETEWSAYIPGPRAVIPWASQEDSQSPDAMASGGLYPLDGSAVTLKTALN